MTTYGAEIVRLGFIQIKLPFELEHTPIGEKCEELIEFNGICLGLIPREKITLELAKMAVSDNGAALRFVPKELKTEEVCDLALEDKGLALKYIPLELKTKGRCITAVKKSVEAFYFVPLDLQEEVGEFITDDGVFE